MARFRFPLRVYIEDTDVGGIVYYVNYLKFMERARTELLRDIGFEQRELRAEGLLFVVQGAEVRYLKPAQLDDELIVETVIKPGSAASLLFQQAVMTPDGTPLCRGEVKVVAVAADTLKPIRIPRRLSSALAPYLIESQTDTE